jgi:hypothetical protein
MVAGLIVGREQQNCVFYRQSSLYNSKVASNGLTCNSLCSELRDELKLKTDMNI